ncbi:hydrolase [Erythrobacter sp. AP23]|jgi:hypothetical protein|uniref:hydrolase n=1 Tax=Erythrobacter sp. AP23 TaxID=499656 RepID=UPI00076CA8E1|nr:hydrolase [Erythrobacter sp. AP23]KWV93765.1 hypothetical protein ASS64_12785 [Erythrobacter sp. AP23]
MGTALQADLPVNATPEIDPLDNTTGCCPRFHPEGWDRQSLHFEDKRFVRATTRSQDHVPVDMDKVFGRVHEAIADAGALDEPHFLVLSRDLSSREAEHLFAVDGEVPDEETVTLSGHFRTRVFDAPYPEAPVLLDAFARELADEGEEVEESYIFYTTCPKCAEAYGHNYMVAVDKVRSREPEDQKAPPIMTM